jgi:lysozyme family protein
MNFDDAVARTLTSEGNYVNNPNDPGGETKYGISKRSYPTVNIKELTLVQAKLIYKRDFWDPLHGDTLHSAVSYQLFDFAVNSSIQTAIRYYQRALGVADDGHWGPISQKASETMDQNDQLMLLIAERQDYQTRLSTWDSFGKGWARRNAQNLRYASQDN